MIIIMVDPTRAEISAALASGFAIETRRGEPIRCISSHEHAIELDALGGRLVDVLPCERGSVTGSGRPDPLPSRLPLMTGYLTDAELEQR
jgi:hypothetical protein